jgi:choline dehydrogenase-like flavoprotein
MLFDFNEAWSRVAETQYDFCVCGTGPAAITTARKLAARGKTVLLLEAGGLSESEQSQEHYKTIDVGRKNWGLVFGRLCMVSQTLHEHAAAISDAKQLRRSRRLSKCAKDSGHYLNLSNMAL